MKKKFLISEDEIILSELERITLTNRRFYYTRGKKNRGGTSNYMTIIQLDKISSVTLRLIKKPVFISLFIVFLLISLVIGGLYLYLLKNDPEQLVSIQMPLLIGAGVSLLLSIIFLIVFFVKRNKAVIIEYISTMDKPLKIIFKKSRLKAFKALIVSIFKAIDDLPQNKENILIKNKNPLF